MWWRAPSLVVDFEEVESRDERCHRDDVVLSRSYWAHGDDGSS